MTADYKDILIAVADGVATITLNRPHQLNAFQEDPQGPITLGVGPISLPKGWAPPTGGVWGIERM